MGGRGAKAGIDYSISGEQITQSATGAPIYAEDVVDKIMNNADDPQFARAMLDTLRVGEKVTLYDPVRENGEAVPGTVEYARTYIKQQDGTWKSTDWYDANMLPLSSYQIGKRIQNGKTLIAGVPDTASSVQITGRPGKEYNGLTYAKGTYDIIRRDDKFGRVKSSVEGSITSYDGVKYGVTKDSSGYVITHIPTGMRVSTLQSYKLKTLNDVSNHIKDVSDYIRKNSSYIDKAANQFSKTIRRDLPSQSKSKPQTRETVKTVAGYSITRLSGTHGQYRVQIGNNQYMTFRTQKAAEEWANAHKR